MKVSPCPGWAAQDSCHPPRQPRPPRDGLPQHLQNGWAWAQPCITWVPCPERPRGGMCRWLWGRFGGIWDAHRAHGAPDLLRGADVLLGQQPCEREQSKAVTHAGAWSPPRDPPALHWLLPLLGVPGVAVLEAGGGAGPVLRTDPGTGGGPRCPVVPGSVRGPASPGLVVAWLSGALRVLRWWDGSARVQGSASPQDWAVWRSSGAELGRAGEGLGGSSVSPQLPTSCTEPGPAWRPQSGPTPVGSETGAVPSGTDWLLAEVRCAS